MTSHRTSDYGSLSSSDASSARSISSAFSRLKYSDLSPVSSYYKPLMRTFTKRFDSPKVRHEMGIIYCYYFILINFIKKTFLA